MNKLNHKFNTPVYFSAYLIFFLCSIFYFTWFANYIFFYQEKAGLFFTTFSFFSEHLNRPGGFLLYLGELQTTFYFHTLTGAILVSGEMVLIMLLINATGKQITGRRLFILPFLIGATLFFLQTNYQYLSFNTLGILAELLFFYLTVRFLKNGKDWIAVVLFPLNYYLFGSFAGLFFLFFSLYLLISKAKLRAIKLAVLLVLFLLFFFIGEYYLFFRTIKSLLTSPFSVQDIGMQIQLFVPLIALIVLIPLLLKTVSFVQQKTGGRRFSLLQIFPFFILLISAGVSPMTIDKKNSHYFYVEKLFYQHKYDEVIRFNSRFPSTNQLTNFLNNIALSETGQLNDQFFNFPQSSDGGTLFLKWEMKGEVLRRGGYFYYSIGMINEAQRWAFEYMVMRGLTPETLKMLIKTELINGNYQTAKKYISMLKNTVYYRSDAKEFEKMLFDDNAVDKDPELGKKNALKTKQDFFVLSDEPAANLDLILEHDSLNSVALEYKLAWLTLQKDMKGIAEQLPVMEKCGFQRIPKNIEEAIVAYKLLHVGEMPELQKLQINPETEQRFNQYYRIFQQNSSNKVQAQKALAKDFGNTFWYYVFFS